MPREESTVSFENVVCKKATAKALLVVIDEEEYWIPVSQVHDDSEVWDDEKNNEGKLVVTEWIAQQKGLL